MERFTSAQEGSLASEDDGCPEGGAEALEDGGQIGISE